MCDLPNGYKAHMRYHCTTYSSTGASLQIQHTTMLVVKERLYWRIRCPLQIARRSAGLPSSSPSSAPRSIAFPNNRSPLTSSRPHRRRDLRSSDSCSLEPPSTARLFPGTAYSRLALLQRGSKPTPKNAAAHHPAAPARITSPQNNARHDPKNGQARG